MGSIKDLSKYEVRYENGNVKIIAGVYLKTIFREGYGNKIVSFTEVRELTQ